jgi:uncharacterized protein (TIGR04222 family)
MSQPWGLSGPQFLGLYGAGMAVAVIAPFLVYLIIRRVPGRGPGRDLDMYEAGYLAGGAQRAAEVVIAELVHAGALRVDSSGRVSQADRSVLRARSAHLSDGDTGLWFSDGIRVYLLRRTLSRAPGIAAIGPRLRAEGLLIARSRLAALRVTWLALWAALFTAGALRLAEGAHNHRPTGELEGLMVVSAFLFLVTISFVGRWLSQGPTTRGTACLRRLRAGQPGDDTPRFADSALPAGAALGPDGGYGGFGLGAAAGGAALFGVALAGFAAFPDEALRTALLAGIPSGSGASGDGGGGGSSCGSGCGGGSSCGGGGCGG